MRVLTCLSMYISNALGDWVVYTFSCFVIWCTYCFCVCCDACKAVSVDGFDVSLGFTRFLNKKINATIYPVPNSDFCMWLQWHWHAFYFWICLRSWPRCQFERLKARLIHCDGRLQLPCWSEIIVAEVSWSLRRLLLSFHLCDIPPSYKSSSYILCIHCYKLSWVPSYFRHL